MEKKRCIFCMTEMEEQEQRCPVCKKAPWEYGWKQGWLAPYTVLKERYLIGRALGEGAFGTVYLAYDQEEKEASAVKVYREQGSLQEARFLEEAKDIPGIVKEKEFFRQDGKDCLAMEYLGGGSLREYLNQRHSLQAEEAGALLLPLLEALVSLHERGIVHCDISPDNLLFNGSGALKLIDFGAAVKRGEPRGEKKLKEGYAPLEQYQDREKIGPWTDLYAFCALWYEMVTGKKVPPAPERLKRDTLKRPSESAKISFKEEEAMMRGLHQQIQGRYFSGENLLARLGKAKEEGFSPAMRREWGDLWIEITAEVERRSVSNRKRGRLRRRLLTGAAAVFGLLAVLLLAGGGLRLYGVFHPEQVTRYLLEKDRQEADQMQENRITERSSEEFQEALEFLRDNAYSLDENNSGDIYRLLPDALRGWSFRGKEEDFFPIRAATLKRIAEQLLGGEKPGETSRDFTGIVYVYPREWNPLEASLRWNDSYTYGEKLLYIDSDYSTGYVTDVSLSVPAREAEAAQEFLYEILPTVSPESWLSKEEIQELFQYRDAEGELLVSVPMNKKCSVSVYEYEYSQGKWISVSIEAGG